MQARPSWGGDFSKLGCRPFFQKGPKAVSVIPIKSAPKKVTPAPYDRLVRPRGDITHDAAAAQWHAALLRATAAGKIAVEHMSKMSNSVMVQQKLNEATRVSAENQRLVAEVQETVQENTRLRVENAELRRRLSI